MKGRQRTRLLWDPLKRFRPQALKPRELHHLQAQTYPRFERAVRWPVDQMVEDRRLRRRAALLSLMDSMAMTLMICGWIMAASVSLVLRYVLDEPSASRLIALALVLGSLSFSISVYVLLQQRKLPAHILYHYNEEPIKTPSPEATHDDPIRDRQSTPG